MNSTIKTILEHRSIRKFTDQKISDEQLELIFDSARSASTSSNLQCGSIIRVTDQAKRERLAEYAGGQAYVASAAEFFVFCVDFNRHKDISPSIMLGYTELTLIGAIDVGLMGQNCLLAAESMGLGGVFIGGIRNSPEQVTELLKLPKYVMPVFGMCIGYPLDDPDKKPRLPLSIVVHENQYQPLDQKALEQYDNEVRQYYGSRRQNQKSQSWSEQITQTLKKESRPHMKAFVNKQGFSIK